VEAGAPFALGTAALETIALTQFALEADLCAVLDPWLRTNWLADESGRLAAQVQIGSIIPDFLLALNRTSLSGAFRARLTGFESAVLAQLLRRDPLRARTVAERLYSQPARTTRALLRLTRLGLVNSTSTGAFTTALEGLAGTVEIVAIEAKLTRWREAIVQARAYLAFANRAFVALPAPIVDRDHRVLEACQAAKLGLLAVSGDGVSVVSSAGFHEPRSASWVWAASRLSAP